MLDGGLGDIRRIVSVSHCEDFHALLLSVDLQLFDRCGAVDIQCDKQGLLALLLELAGDLGSGRRLTCTLQTDHHHDGHLLAGLQRKLGRLASHQGRHLFVDDLDHHLGGIDAVHDLFTDCSFLHGVHKLFDNLEVDVRFQKRHLDFPHRGLDVALCELALAAQFVKYAV